MSDNAIMQLYQVNAMINAMEALAFNHKMVSQTRRWSISNCYVELHAIP